MAGKAKKHGVAGNKNPQKFKTPAERQKVFKLFIEHLANGYDVKNFAGGCTHLTVIKMLKDYPEEFDMEDVDLAHATGRLMWEKYGKLGTIGKLPGFNASAWWRIMQNKLRWKDRMEHGSDPENPLPTGAGGAGALNPVEKAVLDHMKEKLLYEVMEQKGIKKGSDKAK